MNPVSYARYLSSHSTTALAKRLDVSRQYISRLEQGLYDKPNKVLLDWTTSTLNKSLDKPVTNTAVENLYREWQWQKRESTKVNMSLLPCSVTEHDKVRQQVENKGATIIYYHRIFRQWRQDYWVSPHAFCVDMCLHPSPVVDYEEGLTHTMPNNLKKVMLELGLIGEGFKTSER
jgi:transcriptional regulator with XRE-family HTH domain